MVELVRCLLIQVDWTNEEKCFHTIAKELADFYMVRPGCLSGRLPPELRKHVAQGVSNVERAEREDEVRAPEEESGAENRSEGVGNDREASAESQAEKLRTAEWSWTTQHVMFPSIRFLLQPPKSFSDDGSVVQLVCTSQLYRVFERC